MHKRVTTRMSLSGGNYRVTASLACLESSRPRTHTTRSWLSTVGSVPRGACSFSLRAWPSPWSAWRTPPSKSVSSSLISVTLITGLWGRWLSNVWRRHTSAGRQNTVVFKPGTWRGHTWGSSTWRNKVFTFLPKYSTLNFLQTLYSSGNSTNSKHTCL